jgi:hypothetical protein
VIPWPLFRMPSPNRFKKNPSTVTFFLIFVCDEKKSMTNALVVGYGAPESTNPISILHP